MQLVEGPQRGVLVRGVDHGRAALRGELEELLAASDGELETVDGVGEIRAKDIREGLRRQQEINLVDRYLQT